MAKPHMNSQLAVCVSSTHLDATAGGAAGLLGACAVEGIMWVTGASASVHLWQQHLHLSCASCSPTCACLQACSLVAGCVA